MDINLDSGYSIEHLHGCQWLTQAMDINIISGATQFPDTNTSLASAWLMDIIMVFSSVFHFSMATDMSIFKISSDTICRHLGTFSLSTLLSIALLDVVPSVVVNCLPCGALSGWIVSRAFSLLPYGHYKCLGWGGTV